MKKIFYNNNQNYIKINTQKIKILYWDWSYCNRSNSYTNKIVPNSNGYETISSCTRGDKLFFDKEFNLLPDTRPISNPNPKWVRDGKDKIILHNKHGELTDVYDKEYCRLRGLDWEDILCKV